MLSLLTSIAVAAVIAVALAGTYWLSTRPWMSLGEASEKKGRALREFREYRALQSDGTTSIFGATSKIVAETDSGTFQAGRVASYSLTLLASSASEQYFMYVFNEGRKPFVKLLSPEEAVRMKRTMKAVE